MPKKINILISSAGTGASWHIVKTIHDNFPNQFRVITADTNPRYLIPASTLSVVHYQVPSIGKSDYLKAMRDIFINEKINYFLPIIDREIYTFNTDDEWLIRHNIHALTVSKQTAQILSDKRNMYRFLKKNNVEIPDLITDTPINKTKNQQYFVKPYDGHGSENAFRINSEKIEEYLAQPHFIIQELCCSPEITVEVFNHNKQCTTICRERIETKAGVCTKAKIFIDSELDSIAKMLCKIMDMPRAFCFQVMKNQREKWAITDINPRLGAGTSMSSAYGFDLTRALIASLTDNHNPLNYLKTFSKPTYVVRVYQDIMMTK